MFAGVNLSISTSCISSLVRSLLALLNVENFSEAYSLLTHGYKVKLTIFL